MRANWMKFRDDFESVTPNVWYWVFASRRRLYSLYWNVCARETKGDLILLGKVRKTLAEVAQ